MTIDVLTKCMPGGVPANMQKYLEPLNLTFEKYEINSALRQAMFLTQIGHESGSLNAIVENLNYTAAALLKVFKNYFTPEQAAQYAHKPEMIANRVYANRIGNGDEASGDGWRFRGRGLIQITGKENYKNLSQELVYDFVANPQDLEKPGAAAMSAGWYWKLRNLNLYSDKGDLQEVRRRINGGTIGLPDCITRYVRCKDAFGI